MGTAGCNGVKGTGQNRHYSTGSSVSILRFKLQGKVRIPLITKIQICSFKYLSIYLQTI